MLHLIGALSTNTVVIVTVTRVPLNFFGIPFGFFGILFGLAGLGGSWLTMADYGRAQQGPVMRLWRSPGWCG